MTHADRMKKDARMQVAVAIGLISIAVMAIATVYFLTGIGR